MYKRRLCEQTYEEQKNISINKDSKDFKEEYNNLVKKMNNINIDETNKLILFLIKKIETIEKDLIEKDYIIDNLKDDVFNLKNEINNLKNDDI